MRVVDAVGVLGGPYRNSRFIGGEASNKKGADYRHHTYLDSQKDYLTSGGNVAPNSRRLATPRAARAAKGGAAAAAPYRSSSTGTIAPSASFTNINPPSPLRSTRMKSPNFTCPVATRLARGKTR